MEANSEQTSSNSNSKNVMVIDDDSDIRDAISQILEYEGYSVSTAANGKEGIDHLVSTQKPPSLILLDLMMPVMNGWQFKSAVDERPELAQIPIVVLSADGNVSRTSADIGVAGYLKKPIQLDTLLETVKQYTS